MVNMQFKPRSCRRRTPTNTTFEIISFHHIKSQPKINVSVCAMFGLVIHRYNRLIFNRLWQFFFNRLFYILFTIYVSHKKFKCFSPRAEAAFKYMERVFTCTVLYISRCGLSSEFYPYTLYFLNTLIFVYFIISPNGWSNGTIPACFRALFQDLNLL